jgi:hypothetical protein
MGLCRYGYQITQANDSCGGADKWADVSSTINIFCPAGQYCPTPVEARNCSTEHFCRLGSTVEESKGYSSLHHFQ